jgi:Rrf2 family protein
MRLRFTKRTDYAIRACLHLVDAGAAPVSSRRIAQEMDIPNQFLPQVLGDLARAGIVESTAGKLGGYQLKRDAADLDLIEIIEAVEGPSRSEHCVLEQRGCDAARPCALHPVWSAAQSAFIHVLATTSLADVAARARAADGDVPGEPRTNLGLGPERIPA